MKIPTRIRQRGLEFNITPLIDIVFLLIIFFLAASHFVRSESLLAVELPVATQHDDEDDEATGRLVITVSPDRQLYVGAHSVDLLAVEQMILLGKQNHPENFEVRIRADRAAPFREVEPILLACARSGVSNVKFAVLPSGND